MEATTGLVCRDIRLLSGYYYKVKNKTLVPNITGKGITCSRRNSFWKEFLISSKNLFRLFSGISFTELSNWSFVVCGCIGQTRGLAEQWPSRSRVTQLCASRLKCHEGFRQQRGVNCNPTGELTDTPQTQRSLEIHQHEYHWNTDVHTQISPAYCTFTHTHTHTRGFCGAGNSHGGLTQNTECPLI